MYTDLINSHLKAILASHLAEGLSLATLKDFHYQSNALLKFKGQKDPMIFGLEVLEKMKEQYGEFYKEITLTKPGFLNFKLNLEKAYLPSLAVSQVPPVMVSKVVIDYGGVNVAKKMHIGHIRSLFIGDYLVRLNKALNIPTILYNHIGDMGNQFGYVIEYIQQQKLDLSKDLNNQKLTELYKQAYALYQADPVFAKKSDNRSKLFQNHDPETIKIWQRIKEISMEENYKVYQKLDVHLGPAHTFGESFYQEMGQKVIEDVLSHELASKDSDGSVVVKFTNDLPPMVLQKSNGNFLYPVFDLAAIKYRCQKDNPSKILYVVDQRQSLHFQQIFWLAQQLNYAPNTELLHIHFGQILDKSQKPIKTRSGESLYLDELFQEGRSILEKEERYKNLVPEIKEEILDKTIIGGLKFYDLRFNRNQNYVFDWKDVLNFQGTSAPYLQNVLVRIDSLFYKHQKENHEKIPVDFSPIFLSSLDDNAVKLLLLVQELPKILQENVNGYQSSKLIDYLMKIGKAFHGYYEKTAILNQTDTSAKLWLCKEVDKSLKQGLDVLGIPYYACLDRLNENYEEKKANKLMLKKSIKP